MQVIKLSQTDDRSAWLELRLGKVTGTKAKSVKPLTRGAERRSAGFWKLLAEKVCISPDGETDIDRGQRLENEALQLTSDKYGIVFNTDPGIWISDDNPDIAVSPDAAEEGNRPTYAAEAKCLSSANHLKYMIEDIEAKESELYRAIDSVPSDSKVTFREQAIQYFVVNEHLERLYFTLYDDRVAFEKYMHHVIVINREDILEDINEQKVVEHGVILELNKIIRKMQYDS